MKTTLKFFALLLLSGLLFTNCQTAKKYVESGDYDSAIDLCLRNLRSKKTKKQEYVFGLETAFKKAQERDLAKINALKAENRGEVWEQIHDIYTRISTRQEKIRPLLPLTSKKGYKPHFEMVDAVSMERESRQKAAEYLYSFSQTLLKQSESGDKGPARRAHDMLYKIKNKYYGSYRDTDALIKKAKDLGTSYVLVEVKNLSGKIIPVSFNERLLAIGKTDLDTEWKAFYFDARPGEVFDYKARFVIRTINISPERILERVYTDEKEIKDGWEYELDPKGNVKKDSLGNDIKRTKYARIRADVLEIHQTKAARLGGTLEIIDPVKNTVIENQDLSSEILFDHFAATFKGDDRALTPASRNLIGSAPIPFPLDEDMLIQAADRLKPSLAEELRCSRAIY